MKRYQFRLEGVLRLRRAEAEQARGALAAANAELRARLVQRDHEASAFRTIARRQDAETLAALLAEREDAAIAQRRLDEAERAVADAAARAAVAQVTFSAAQRRVSALERLEARRREEYDGGLRREESLLLDEIATARYLAAPPHTEAS